MDLQKDIPLSYPSEHAIAESFAQYDESTKIIQHDYIQPL